PSVMLSQLSAPVSVRRATSSQSTAVNPPPPPSALFPYTTLFRSSASLQRTFKKSFTSFSHSTRNKTRDGLIRVRNIRALNGRFNTSITHAYSIVIGSKHITLNATGGGFLTASKQFRHGAT